MSVTLNSKIPRHSRRLLTAGIAVAFMTSSPSSAEPDPQKEEKEAMKGTFPTLDILPEGSILRRVRLPRYNKEFMPISLLTAETLTVLDEYRIDGKDITIELYDEDGGVDARTKMRHAIYNQKLSTLHANEAVYIEGKQYVANGTGLVFDLTKRQGFLIGPVNTRFNKPMSDNSTTMIPKPKQAPRAIASSLMVLTMLNTAAEPPARLTAKQLGELDQLSQPAKPPVSKLTPAEHEKLDRLIEPLAPKIAIEQKQTHSTLEENNRMNKMANASMSPFLKKIDQGALLVSTSSPETTEKPAAEEAKPEIAEKKPAEAKPKKPVPTLKVTCDGGLYFDSDTGVLAYLKNIRLDEPSFNLSCTKELKVFLEKKEPKKPESKKTDDKNKQAPKEDEENQEDKDTEKNKDTEPTEKTKNSASKEKSDDKKEDKLKNTMSSFGDVRRIIATGKVKLTRRDDEGNTFIATAETASYDAKTGEMILRGGLPRLQMAANQYLQARGPGQYIRVLKSGKLITEAGKWEMVTPTKLDKP